MNKKRAEYAAPLQQEPGRRRSRREKVHRWREKVQRWGEAPERSLVASLTRDDEPRRHRNSLELRPVRHRQ